jgi:Tfp pilus assembly protein PilX
MRIDLPPIPLARRALRAARAQDGFTLIIALGVMLVTSLLLVAAFTAADGDIQTSHESAIQKQAYYAALAGIQEYQFQLEKEPDYWEKCATPTSSVPENSYERYEVKPLAANSITTGCSTTKPFETMIESTGAAANTFRIESTGCAGVKGLTSCSGQKPSTVQVRKVVATFTVTGFLQFVYFTRFEDEDPALYKPSANCEKYYLEEKNGKKEYRSSECEQIQFVTGDSVKGPMHTDDTIYVCGNPEFGRKERLEKGIPDKIEVNGGIDEGCGSNPTFNTASKTYSKGRELVPPASDESLRSYVEEANEFTGVTQLVLNGSANTITVINSAGEEEPPLKWPANGLIYVANSDEGCGYQFSAHEADGPREKGLETNCGNVYVHGSYSQSLTIAAENDVIVNGSLYPTSVAGNLGGTAPTGTNVLGLIATNFVRVYHPVGETYEANESRQTHSGHTTITYTCNNGDSLNGTTCKYQNDQNGCDAPNLTASEDKAAGGYGWGKQENIWIYAAILSTRNSFVVDNYDCGSELGKLHVYGAIAQNFRGIVGTSANTGYLKGYEYDQRLASDEPPYFLQPLNTGWEIERETANQGG